MKRFLRYNGRHQLYFSRDAWLPQLNPMTSSSHSKSGKRTKRFYEPSWLFHLRQRAFAFAGHHRCGRRDDAFSVVGRYGDGPKADTWDIGPDGNRTCSYCGSIHFDDLLAICRKVLVDNRYAIEGTTKSYKVYVSQPDVRNAGEGAIKFYMHHVPKEVSSEDQSLYGEAFKVSHDRMMARFARPKAG